MSLEAFLTSFYPEYEKINEELKSLEPSEDSMSKYDLIAKRIQVLQNLFSDNFSGLPTFEQRKAQNHLEKLSNYASQRRNEVFPKKKFGFKSKNKLVSGAELQKVQTGGNFNKAQENSQPQLTNHTCTIKDLTNETVVKQCEEVNAQDIGIFNLKNCVVKLIGKPSVLHLSNIEDTTILCGPIVGSAFINKCKNSKLNLACHQLRIHESLDTDFYINVASRAIIENCKNVRFGPYSWSYKGVNENFNETNLKMIDNYEDDSWKVSFIAANTTLTD